MNCEAVDEMLGAYALDAVSPAERAAIEAHLLGCGSHAEAVALRRAAGAIASSVQEREPPPRLRASILGAIAADDATVRGPAVARPPLWLRPSFAYAVAAGFALLAAGLFAWNLTLERDSTGDSEVVVRLLQGSEGAGAVAYFEDREIVVLRVEAFMQLPADQTYQAWAIVDGRPRSLGLLSVHATGGATIAMDAPFADVEAFAVSVEPAGGSEAPTTEPILVATL